MSRYLKLLKNYLGKARINHCLSTASFMKKNADLFKIDSEKAYLAGLLHDLAKRHSDKEVIELSDHFIKRKIFPVKYYDFKLNYPVLLHGTASAELLIEELQITDPAILEAVSSHTTSGENVSKLSIFMFISDFCEPEREYEHSKMVSNILLEEKNFYKAYFKTCYFKIECLLNKFKLICPEAIEGYNYALQLWQEEI